MTNQHLEERMKGMQEVLMGIYNAGYSMSSNTKGSEREIFLDNFLSRSLPPIYRFGSGDAIDLHSNKSGQLDIVVEFPFAPNIPSIIGESRLYPAESVGAVVEVKSNIKDQWSQLKKTAEQLEPLQREMAGPTRGGVLSNDIPLLVASYKGWKNLSTIERRMKEVRNLAGVLVIGEGLFASADNQWGYAGTSCEGPNALWAFVCCLYRLVGSVQPLGSFPSKYL